VNAHVRRAKRSDMPDRSISELEQVVRDHINRTRKQHTLLKDPAAWNQLCSSLDVIGDTELAIDAYDAAPETDDAGATYILVYGVLQALILQQDAVLHLAEALNLKYDADPLLSEIREVRNASVGHPTKRHGQPRSHFISRISMTKAGFQLLTVYPGHGPAQFKGVSLPGLIATQRSQLASILGQVASSLQREEAEHKAMFKDKKLAAAFPTTTDYYVEKIYESIPAGKSREYGRLHVTLIAEAVERFKALLAERGLTGVYDSVEYHLDLVSYPLDRLGEYFDASGQSTMNERDALIFVHFVQDQLTTLRKMAAEVDQDYGTNSDAQQRVAP
jgi:hypothetical protein